jgi:hypothetical protein
MPYIHPRDRERLDFDHEPDPLTAGELNYCITKLCLRFVSHGVNYRQINEVVGVLECCKLEFYRRLAAPYEDTKINENGDVYP